MANTVPAQQPTLTSQVPLSRGRVYFLWDFARKKPVGTVAATILILLALSAIFAPLLSPFDPLQTRAGPIQDAPSWKHPFGTDQYGRDMLSRVLFGGRTSLMIGVLSVMMGATAGSTIGIVTGYLGGWLDLILQRILESFDVMPGLVVALAIVTVLGASVVNVAITIAFVAIPGTTRIVRSATLAVKASPFIDAAKALGATSPRILARHILPNVAAPILVIVSVQIGSAILTSASLSFLGFGAPPPVIDWGGMLSREARQHMQTAPWMAIFPGLFLTLTILGFNLFGDALRDVMDPRMRGTGKVRGR